MATAECRRLEALQCLLRRGHLSRADDLAPLAGEAAACLGARRASVYVVDYDQVLLLPLPDGSGDPPPVPLGIDATLAGRAFRDVALQTTAAGTGPIVWAPLVDGAERLGVIELGFPPGIDLGEVLIQSCQDLAGLLAEFLVTRSLYGDAIERVRRRTPLTLPAELQWRLLPPLTFVCPSVAVAGTVAPSHEVAGDSFDYSVNGNLAHIAIIDAMGHGLEATLLASVTIASLRNARRRGSDLTTTVATLDQAIAAAFGPDKFVTGIFGELNTDTGTWTWTTCGHPPALVVRRGRVVKTLDAVIAPPLGLGLLSGEPELADERLEPGDRLLLYTDGVIEARDASGNFFGTERLVDFVVKEAAAGRPAAETLRRLNHEILSHQEGALQDDATTVMVEWLTDQPVRSIPDLRTGTRASAEMRREAPPGGPPGG